MGAMEDTAVEGIPRARGIEYRRQKNHSGQERVEQGGVLGLVWSVGLQALPFPELLQKHAEEQRIFKGGSARDHC